MIGGTERLLFDIIRFFDKDKFDIKLVTVIGSGPLENSFRKLGVPIYFAGFSSKKLPPKLYWILIAPITLIRITRFLFKSKPDIVISSLLQADILGMTAAKIAGVKKRILIQHDIIEFKKPAFLIKKNFAIRFSTKIVAISDSVREFLVEYFQIENKKITTIFNGIDYERFKKGRKTFSQNNLVIGVVGRLEEIKGQKYVLEALKIIKDKYNLTPAVLFAGDGSLRDNLEKYTIQNNLSLVKFLGNVSDVPAFLSEIDVLIVSSISEGFGLVVLEGMVSGKLVIASDIPAIRELIHNGENGLLFKSQNSNSLADGASVTGQ